LNAKRRAEIRNLKWSDVDFDRGFILLRDPKSGEDERIPLGDAAIGVIKAHQRVQQVTPNSDAAAALLEAGFQSASSLTESQYVFTGEKDGPRGLRQIGESSRAIRDAAGLPKDFRPNHGLLHTFASHLASSGEVDLYILQKMMTHKGPLMTQRYAHLTDAALKRGADVMSRIVKEAKETA
jgi:integrase